MTLYTDDTAYYYYYRINVIQIKLTECFSRLNLYFNIWKIKLYSEKLILFTKIKPCSPIPVLSNIPTELKNCR